MLSLQDGALSDTLTLRICANMQAALSVSCVLLLLAAPVFARTGPSGNSDPSAMLPSSDATGSGARALTQTQTDPATLAALIKLALALRATESAPGPVTRPVAGTVPLPVATGAGGGRCMGTSASCSSHSDGGTCAMQQGCYFRQVKQLC